MGQLVQKATLFQQKSHKKTGLTTVKFLTCKVGSKLFIFFGMVYSIRSNPHTTFPPSLCHPVFIEVSGEFWERIVK